MACTITAPTLNVCNDLQGGVKILSLAPWEEAFDPVTATWTVIPLHVNSASVKETPSVNSANSTAYYTHEVSFKVNGISNFAGFGDLAKARICAKAELYDGTTVIVVGIEKGLSFSGGERGTGMNMEDAIGSTMTFSGVSSVSWVENPV